MLVRKVNYSPEALENLSALIRSYHDQGHYTEFEILVDGLKVIRRTAKLEMFPLFENFLSADSKRLEVLIYNGTSNNNDKHLFLLAEEEQEKGLSGLEIDSRIREGLDKEKREWEHKLLLTENTELKSQIEELEKEVEELEKEREKMLDSQSPLKGFLGEIGSSFVESFIRRNPKLLASIPGGDALAGIIEEDNKARHSFSQEDETEVSFKPKQAMKEEDKASIQFVNELKTRFTKDEFDKVLEILEVLASDKSKIEEVKATLTGEILN